MHNGNAFPVDNEVTHFSGIGKKTLDNNFTLCMLEQLLPGDVKIFCSHIDADPIALVPVSGLQNRRAQPLDLLKRFLIVIFGQEYAIGYTNPRIAHKNFPQMFSA